jgi:hypothetical protein
MQVASVLYFAREFNRPEESRAKFPSHALELSGEISECRDSLFRSDSRRLRLSRLENARLRQAGMRAGESNGDKDKVGTTGRSGGGQ